MNDTSDELKAAKELILKLEARVDALEAFAKRRLKAQLERDRTVSDYFSLHGAKVADLYQRMINIELTLFPGMLTDIAQLEKVIGTRPTLEFNPLDSRPATKRRKKKSDDKS